MKRPSFQFYPADWRNNAKLRRCSWGARGAWLEVMCLMHDSEEYGVLRWPLREIAQAIGAPASMLKELADKGVIRGGDDRHEEYVYTPMSGRVKGSAVVLVSGGSGAMWMSTRMVVDEYVRQKKGNHKLFESSPNRPLNPSPNPSPMPPIGELLGDELGHENHSPMQSPMPPKSDLPTSTSTSTYSYVTHTDGAPAPPVCVDNFQNSDQPDRVCAALAKAGIPSISPKHPELLALIERGVALDAFVLAATNSVAKGKGFAYMVGILSNQIAGAAAIKSGPSAPTEPWDSTRKTIEAMGERLGMGRWNEADVSPGREHFAGYTARVRAAVEASQQTAGA